jgi:glutamate-ammonia-ligase adenylyltransferase
LLARQASVAWEQILERADKASAPQLRAALADEVLATELPRVLACSPFVAGLLRRRPEMLLAVMASGHLHSQLAGSAFRQELARQLDLPGADPGIVLRRFRQWHMLRIVWRDFCRLADTRETVRDTSLLAEACIAEALARSQLELEKRFGQPRGAKSGEPQQLIVLGMGKLGARELNVSSDIDLIFTYPEAGTTDGAGKSISNEQFFAKLGQALIAMLDQVTAEGFVFRVDMRLRPYGESGALVHNFAALEEYYQDQGRDWERYALIKARPLTGSPRRAVALMQALRPFIYRRYIDFGVIESLRGMKQMINTEVRRRGLQDDVKLGHGGIREVEFIAQCFQLIRGGRDRGLQQRELLAVLEECAVLGCLPPAATAELARAYLFLRDSEHAIQGYQDRQSQALPAEDRARLAMATVMGFDSWNEYLVALDRHRDVVSRHFSGLIAAPEDEEHREEEDLPPWDESLSVPILQGLGFRESAQALHSIEAFRNSKRVTTLQAQGKERLDQFMPLLIHVCSQVTHPDLALERVLPLVVAVLRRSAYLVLLLENPLALKELVLLCAASPWIAEQLARSPVLLDEFLDRASLYSAPDRQLLQDELRQQLAHLGEEDLEAQMDGLRYFKASQVLRVAASELDGRLPLMKVSDNLTWIAEVILEQVLAVAWADLTRKYGEPQRASEGYGFAVFGYGKLGGIELGYSSDLDLVFVCDAKPQATTGGERSIDNAVFYTRLGQRMIHILETRMTLGQLYEVDMRLRPSGDSGMLVSSVDGFRTYQHDSAWTWEHQALVRARQVAGDVSVGGQVEKLRREILCQRRDEPELAREVVKMRAKMREHLLPREASHPLEFNLKQGTGGIVDIEFMVQFAVLAWAHKVPDLAQWSDNVRILETLGRERLFSPTECEALTGAYLAYRSEVHRRALQQQPDVVEARRFLDHRRAVTSKWQQLFPSADHGPSPTDLRGS